MKNFIKKQKALNNWKLFGGKSTIIILEALKKWLFITLISSYANRGNVAIIVWNTLEAPYVWDVNNTEYEGTINLGNSERSLLSIYFRDFSFEDSSKNRVLKEAEYMTVEAVPSTDGELGEHQIKLAAEDENDADYKKLVASIKDTKKPRGTDNEEWTSFDDDDDVIIAYAPTFDDLDSFYGKVVTVIFGKDNEVVSIRIVDDTVDNEYLTAFEKDKLTIGGKSYKFADDAAVYVNTVKMTEECTKKGEKNHDKHDDSCGYVGYNQAMTEIGKVLDGGSNEWDWSKDYNKVIKANITLNSKDKVTRLDLFVSGDYDKFETREAVVSKVRNEVISLKSSDADIDEINYSEGGDYEEEDDQPRVIKDNKVIALEDIAVGDVLTCYYKEEKGEKKIKTIYVSSSKKDGELTRISKTDLRMTVDGERYYASMGESTQEFLYTDDKLSDAKKFSGAIEKYIGEDVTLYLNVYGEYVLMASDKESNDWTFGIVTSVRDTEDDDIYRIPVRIMLADGTTSRNYKFIFDDEEDDGTLENWEKKIEGLKNNLVVFSADANGEIAADDYEAVEMKDTSIADGDYETKVASTSAKIDDNRERIDDKVFASSTVIFNLGKDKDGDKYDPSVSKRWKDLLDNGKLNQKSLLIYEEDSKTLSYVLIVNDDYGTSSSQYAIVVTDDYKEKNGSTTKRYVDLLLANASDAETFEAKELDKEYAVGFEKMFVEYQLSGSKLEVVTELIDLPEFKKLKTTEEVGNDIINANKSGDTKLVVTLFDKDYDEHNAVHGTVSCPNASDETATTCSENCSNFDPYVKEHYEKSEDDGLLVKDSVTDASKEISTTDANAKALDGTTFSAGDKVKLVPKKDATHGTVACSNNDNKATECTCSDFEAYVAPTVKGTIKANFKVVDTQKLLLEYEDDEDEVERSFKDVTVDEDVVVYDARDGKLTETTFKALQDEVKEEGYVYVIPFANKDAADYGENTVDANILVIVK